MWIVDIGGNQCKYSPLLAFPAGLAGSIMTRNPRCRAWMKVQTGLKKKQTYSFGCRDPTLKENYKDNVVQAASRLAQQTIHK